MLRYHTKVLLNVVILEDVNLRRWNLQTKSGVKEGLHTNVQIALLKHIEICQRDTHEIKKSL